MVSKHPLWPTLVFGTPLRGENYTTKANFTAYTSKHRDNNKFKNILLIDWRSDQLDNTCSCLSNIPGFRDNIQNSWD